jgi:hypothetical protein
MRRPSSIRSLLLPLAALALAGCDSLTGTDDDDALLRVGRCVGPATSAPEALVAPLRGGGGASSAELATGNWLARQVPGYAGAFYENDRFVLLVTEPGRAAEMKTALAATGYRPAEEWDAARVRRARWDVAQLYDWKLYIDQVVGWERGVVSFYYDMPGNRLVYGMEDEGSRQRFAERLVDAGIPCDLILLSVDGYPVLL